VTNDNDSYRQGECCGITEVSDYFFTSCKYEDKQKPRKNKRMTAKNKPVIKLKRIRDIETSQLPTKGTALSAGFDLYSCFSYAIPPGQVVKVSTGWNVQIPEGYELQIRPRSSMGAKGIVVPNSPGTIDADYRGEICVLLLNAGEREYYICQGDKIAQMVLKELPDAILQEVTELDTTERGTSGFGSTGK